MALTNEVFLTSVQTSNIATDLFNELLPAAYKELRKLAAYFLRQERPNHTLQPTALVHEAYLRLVKQNDVSWQSREQFFAIAAQMMRRILVDYAKSQHRQKRGGEQTNLSLDDVVEAKQEPVSDIIALNDALTTLATLYPRKAQVVELRYFGGLSVEETAEVLGISDKTVMRDWNFAKAWLYQTIKKEIPTMANLPFSIERISEAA
jgi:RNA polymerase sigma factor (TIGR02999 family)